MNNNDSLFWAVASIVSIALAAVFLVLFIFGLLPTATLAIWILAAVSALVLFVLLLKSPGPVSSWPYTGASGNAAAAGSAPASGSAPTPPARICCGCNCRCRCPVLRTTLLFTLGWCTGRRTCCDFLQRSLPCSSGCSHSGRSILLPGYSGLCL